MMAASVVLGSCSVVAETNGAYSTDRAVTSGRARPFCRRTQL